MHELDPRRLPMRIGFLSFTGEPMAPSISARMAAATITASARSAALLDELETPLVAAPSAAAGKTWLVTS